MCIQRSRKDTEEMENMSNEISQFEKLFRAIKKTKELVLEVDPKCIEE